MVYAFKLLSLKMRTCNKHCKRFIYVEGKLKGGEDYLLRTIKPDGIRFMNSMHYVRYLYGYADGQHRTKAEI